MKKSVCNYKNQTNNVKNIEILYKLQNKNLFNPNKKYNSQKNNWNTKLKIFKINTKKKAYNYNNYNNNANNIEM